jgi:hypothetical protein
LNRLGQSRQDATPRHIDGADRQAQLRRGGRGTPPFDGRPPEGLPGRCGELVANPGGRTPELLPLKLLLPGVFEVSRRAGLLGQAPLRITAAAAPGWERRRWWDFASRLLVTP